VPLCILSVDANPDSNLHLDALSCILNFAELCLHLSSWLLLSSESAGYSSLYASYECVHEPEIHCTLLRFILFLSCFFPPFLWFLYKDILTVEDSLRELSTTIQHCSHGSISNRYSTHHRKDVPKAITTTDSHRKHGHEKEDNMLLRLIYTYLDWLTTNECIDFDGTIFMQDTGHQLFDNFGCGPDRRAVLAKQLESGERTFREVSDELYSSLNVPFEDGFEVMKSALDIDPDFETFHEFCVNNNIPFNVISAGLKPMLRRVLDHFIGEDMSKHIQIVANDVKITKTENDEHNWEAVWKHDNDLGHDKAVSMQEARHVAELEADNGTIPMIVFIGDGVSDLPAAREADVLFARRGLKLEDYCIEHNIKHIAFDTFADIQKEVTKLAKLDEEKTKGRGLPSLFNPRANLWRRASSKNAIPVFSALTPRREDKAFLWPEVFTEPVPIMVAEAAPVA